MRAYINGKLSAPNGEQLGKIESFLPAGLWFANPDEDFDFEVSDSCIRLDGLYTEGSVDEETKEFSCRWKGIELCHMDEIDGYLETEDFSIEDFTKIIEEKDMRLVNIDAYYDGDINVEITNLVLVDYYNDTRYEFDTNLIDKIEFIE